MTELIPSDHLRAVRRAVSALAKIKSDPNVPAKIETISRLTHRTLDEYKLELELQGSLGQSLALTSSETQDLQMIGLMIAKTKHYRDICITAEKREALQQEIDALETVLSLAMEAL